MTESRGRQPFEEVKKMDQTLTERPDDGVTLGALRSRGWRFYYPASDRPRDGGIELSECFDGVTLGGLRSRGWLIYAALSQAYQGTGTPLLASDALPASLPPPKPVAPARLPAPPVATAPAPAPTSLPLSLEEVWHNSPETRAEFQNSLGAWLAWNNAHAAGHARIHGGPGTAALIAQRTVARAAQRQVDVAAAPPAVDPNLPISERATAEWDRGSPELHAEFGSLSRYTTYRTAEERGQIRRLAPAPGLIRSLRIAPDDSVGAR